MSSTSDIIGNAVDRAYRAGRNAGEKRVQAAMVRRLAVKLALDQAPPGTNPKEAVYQLLRKVRQYLSPDEFKMLCGAVEGQEPMREENWDVDDPPAQRTGLNEASADRLPNNGLGRRAGDAFRHSMPKRGGAMDSFALDAFPEMQRIGTTFAVIPSREEDQLLRQRHDRSGTFAFDGGNSNAAASFDAMFPGVRSRIKT